VAPADNNFAFQGQAEAKIVKLSEQLLFIKPPNSSNKDRSVTTVGMAMPISSVRSC